MFVSTGERTEPAGAHGRGSGGDTVLGIDPGLTRCGYAVLSARGTRPVAIAIGVLTTSSSSETPERLGVLHADIEELLEEFSPSVMAIEQVFQRDNTRSAMTVAHASGAIMAIAARRGLPVLQYTPTQVKAAVTGDGAADKAAVGRMVRMRLGLEAVPSPADAADAAAVALCHLACAPLSGAITRAHGGARP